MMMHCRVIAAFGLLSITGCDILSPSPLLDAGAADSTAPDLSAAPDAGCVVPAQSPAALSYDPPAAGAAGWIAVSLTPRAVAYLPTGPIVETPTSGDPAGIKIDWNQSPGVTQLQLLTGSPARQLGRVDTRHLYGAQVSTHIVYTWGGEVQAWINGVPQIPEAGPMPGPISALLLHAVPATVHVEVGSEHLDAARVRAMAAAACVSPRVLVAAVGDSLTSCYQCWHARANERLGVGVALVSNWGHSGDTIVQILARLDAVLAQPWDVVVVLGGTNDLMRDGRPASEAEANLAAIYARIAATGARVVAVTVPPTRGSKVWPTWWSPTKQAELDALNERIRAAPVWRVVDAYRLFDDGTGAFRTTDAQGHPLTGDGVHPYGAGNDLLGEAVAEAMK